ncbi:MAG: beta-lactamase family protein, partial [Bacteroidales bacterium]|nr:beta-lactamase family protein [Bacteroidales bacterium]
SQGFEEQFDTLLMKKFNTDEPGGTVLVVKKGEVIYRKAFETANLELDVDMNPEYIFRIGSITKQFTACAILKLMEEGKLSLQDDITKHIKDYPTHGHTITIEHLLTHTSGIKSYTSMDNLKTEMRNDRTPEKLIEYFKNEPMEFAPGEKYRYNNSAYAILGYVIEILSGKTYAEYIDSVFFQPLDMRNSFYGSTSRIINNRTAGYQKNDEVFENADFLSMTLPYSAGSLLSNIDDLYIWYDAVMNDKVISKESLEKAHTTFKLNNGKPTGYGYGWFIGNIQGSPMIQHGGGINGYLTSSMYLPEEEVFAAVFSNCDCNPPGDLVFKLAAITIGKPYQWEKIEMSKETLISYEGVYESEFDGEHIVSFEEGGLVSMRSGGTKYKILPYEKDKFFFEDALATIEFQRNKKGKIISVVSKGTGLSVTWNLTDKPVPKLEAQGTKD